MNPHPLSLRWSSIAAGSFLSLLLLGAFALLATALGLFTWHFERGDSPNILILAITVFLGMIAVVISFAAGGAFTALLASSRDAWEGAVHGLTTFALSALLLVTLIGPAVLFDLTGLFARAGIAPNGKSANEILLDQVSDLKIVTDLKILKGNAVTTIKPLPREQTAHQGEKRVDTRKVREGAATGSLALLGLLVLGAGSATWGGRRSALRELACDPKAA